MVWKIEFDEKALFDLRKLGKPIQKKILAYLKNRVANLDDPRSSGKPLRGEALRGIWRYRVEDYRILCSIEDSNLISLLLPLAIEVKFIIETSLG